MVSMVLPILLLSLVPIVGVGASAATTVDVSSLPIDVYIVSLAGVGNYRASNNSKVVDGVLQATRVSKVGVFLDWNKVLDVNVSVTAHVVSDWEIYRTLIELDNDVIVVNTHDEYLPVPSGYTKEGWVDKVADLMLNRWGTWVHAGGYPLYRAWYQNGTSEEWGEEGFQRLMAHIGIGDLTCYLPAGWKSEQLATFEGEYLVGWRFPYENHSVPINSFARANPSYPLNAKDFNWQTLYPLYLSPYLTGGTIYFSPNQTAFNYGIYVHLSAWRFFDANDNEFPELHEFAMGFISTAAAIWADVGDATLHVYGTFSDTPRDRIQVAKLQGRTVGLDQAEGFLQKAIDAYNAHNYKLSVAYAKQVETAAEKATQYNPWPQIVTGIAVAGIALGVGTYYRKHYKSGRKES